MLGANTIKITQNHLITIGQVDEFKGLWRGLSKHTTSLALVSDVSHFGPAFEKTLSGLKSEVITVTIVKQLHRALNNGNGDIKTSDTVLEIGNQVLETAPPDQAEVLLEKLLHWTNDSLNQGQIHPLIVLAVFVAVFLQIHPFATGNQKTLHLLLNVFMLKSGYNYAPYAAFSQIINEQGEAFYKALRHNQASLESGKPDWSVWVDFFLSCLKVQAEILYNRLENQKDEIAKLPALSAKIMKLFEDHKRLQMKQIIDLTRGRRSTIKLRLQELVDGGYLKRHGQARSTWYALT